MHFATNFPRKAAFLWARLGILALASTFGVQSARAGGAVLGWGLNADLQCQAPAGLLNAVAIAAGDSHSLALRADGTVVGWGLNAVGQATAPVGLSNVVAIAARASYSVALKKDGSLAAWGQFPEGSSAQTDLVAVAAGWTHCLGLKRDGTVVSWGTDTIVPEGLSGVIAVAAGNSNSLALLGNGTVVAWGDNSYGKASVPSGLSNVVAIAAGQDHCLALKANGSVVAWGGNYVGQRDLPSSLTNVVALAAGAFHSLALRADGSLEAWGDNSYNQAVINSPVTDFIGLAGGGFHSLAIKGDGTPFLLTPPKDQQVITTQTATFQVVAVGKQPLRFQWQHDGVNIGAATNATLVIRNVTVADGGAYTVTVLNAFGSTSATAILTAVETPPFITSQPQDQTTICGETATFQVTANGSAPLRYQWQFEGTPLAGATKAKLTLASVSGEQAGFYQVVVTNAFGSVTSAPARLTITVEPPEITSTLTADAVQGQPFTYQVTALHSPLSFSAAGLPPGLVLNSTNGAISGAPLESGTFGAVLTAANACTFASATLVITVASSAPVITSSLTAAGTENAPFTYQITATESPVLYGVYNLPVGLTVDPATGLLSGQSIYPGDFYPTLWASNQWGIGSAQAHFTFTNATIAGLSIANVTTNYSSPYLLDFAFSLRDNEDPTLGNAVVVEPRLLSVTCLENDQAVSPSETAVMITRGTTKQLKASLVLDFTESIASLENGDTNLDGLSDAVDTMVASAQAFVNQQPADAQVAVYEFHREDMAPQQVLPFTTDKTLLNQAIAGIWTNYVDWFPAGSRCWDALSMAVTDLGNANRDEEHFVIFVSDGRDESSTSTIEDVVTAATNQNIKVYCVGFGAEIDTTTLESITTQTSGRFYAATNVADLATEFGQIGKDLAGQYILRWATLKRSGTSFMPSFKISYQGLTANSPTNPVYEDLNNPIIDTNAVPPTTNYPLITNFIISPYTPTEHTGTVTVGALRLVADAEVRPSGVTLRAAYVPRYIRQLRIHYRANWPCTTSLQSTNFGELLYGWSLTETNDGNGGTWMLLSSSYPQSVTNSLPFASFGRLVTFSFKDIISSSNAFSLFEMDNTIYTNTGRQSFVVENTNEFLTTYPPLPYGTPVPWLMAHGFTTGFTNAEISDPDGDGFLTWQEYRANTDPQDATSKLFIRTVIKGADGRYEITFPTAVNRTYGVEASTDLVNWETVRDAIPGINTDVTVTDTRYVPGASGIFYRIIIP